jgi:hypothetical protein
MARPRYSAAKRAREIRKQEERARKLARKHGRAAQRASESTPDAGTLDGGTPGTPEAQVVVSEETPEPASHE